MSGKPLNDIQIGDKFGKLKVLNLFIKVMSGRKVAYAKCICDCGLIADKYTQTRLRHYKSLMCPSCAKKKGWDKVIRLPKHEQWLRRQEKEYIFGAKYRKLEFSLTREEFRKIHQDTCTYCGTLPANGIDRINNKLGYTIENATSCCSLCNYAKRELDVDEFMQWIRRAYKFSASWRGLKK